MYSLARSLTRPKDTHAEGLALYQKLLAWPDLETTYPTMFQRVKKDIYIIENLTVGKKAPDIIGKDQEGKEFKLSDYHGKVVLLDFWGIW